MSMVVDPVCRMEVDEDRSKYGSRYKGKNYYFCSSGCKKKFDEDPEKYIKMTQDIGGNPEKCCD
jgi:YHS domain-containing protein